MEIYCGRNWSLFFWAVHLSLDLECRSSANIFYYRVCPEFSSLIFFLFWLISPSGNSPNFTPGHLFNFLYFKCSTGHLTNLKTLWKAGKEKWFSGRKWYPFPLKQNCFHNIDQHYWSLLSFCVTATKTTMWTVCCKEKVSILQVGAGCLFGVHKPLQSSSLVRIIQNMWLVLDKAYENSVVLLAFSFGKSLIHIIINKQTIFILEQYAQIERQVVLFILMQQCQWFLSTSARRQTSTSITLQQLRSILVIFLFRWDEKLVFLQWEIVPWSYGHRSRVGMVCPRPIPDFTGQFLSACPNGFSPVCEKHPFLFSNCSILFYKADIALSCKFKSPDR